MYDWRQAIQNMYKNLGLGTSSQFTQAPFYQQNTGQFSHPVSNYFGAPLPNNPGQPQGPGSSGGLLDVAGQPPSTTPAPIIPPPAPAPAAAPQPAPAQVFTINPNSGIGKALQPSYMGGHDLLGRRFGSEQQALDALKATHPWRSDAEFEGWIGSNGYDPDGTQRAQFEKFMGPGTFQNLFNREY